MINGRVMAKLSATQLSLIRMNGIRHDHRYSEMYVYMIGPSWGGTKELRI